MLNCISLCIKLIKYSDSKSKKRKKKCQKLLTFQINQYLLCHNIFNIEDKRRALFVHAFMKGTLYIYISVIEYSFELNLKEMSYLSIQGLIYPKSCSESNLISCNCFRKYEIFSKDLRNQQASKIYW